MQYKSLKEFTDHLDKNAKPLPLKIMGERRRDAFFTATMLAEFYGATGDPDGGTPASAPFGVIDRRGASLNPTTTYSAITAPSVGLNLFQGDVVEYDLQAFAAGVPQHRFVMVVSQSCDIGNAPTTVACPLFRESELTAGTIDLLRGRPSKSPQAALAARQNWLRNESIRFAAFPAKDASSIDETFIVALALASVVPVPNLVAAAPVLRLTYRALSFLQWRIGALYLRDVQNSDETRDF